MDIINQMELPQTRKQPRPRVRIRDQDRLDDGVFLYYSHPEVSSWRRQLSNIQTTPGRTNLNASASVGVAGGKVLVQLGDGAGGSMKSMPNAKRTNATMAMIKAIEDESLYKASILLQDSRNFLPPSSQSSGPPSVPYDYPTSTALIVILHLVYIHQWMNISTINSRRRRQRRTSRNTNILKNQHATVSYFELVQKKQFFRLWLALVSHYHTPPSFASSSDSGSVQRSGATLSALNIPLGDRESRETEIFNTLRDAAARYWTFFNHHIGGRQQLRNQLRSLFLLLYNSHLLWSCRALEVHYYNNINNYSDASTTPSSFSSARTCFSCWLAYTRVLVVLASWAVLLELFVTHRLLNFVRTLLRALHYHSSSSLTPQQQESVQGLQDALHRLGYSETSVANMRLRLLRRNVAAPAHLTSALAVVFGEHFSRVPLQVFPFVANPSILLNPTVSFLVVVSILLVLSSRSYGSGGAAASSGGGSSTNTTIVATRLNSASSADTAGNQQQQQQQLDNDDYSLAFLHVFCGLVVGSFWSWGALSFLADASWGNAWLLLLVLFSLISAKTNRFWAPYLVCIDYVAMDSRGRIRVPDAESGDALNDRIGDSESDNIDERDNDSSSVAGETSDNEDSEAIGESDSDNEVQRAYPRQDDEQIYGLLPEMSAMMVDIDLDDDHDEPNENGRDGDMEMPTVGSNRQRRHHNHAAATTGSPRSNVRSRRGG